MISGFHRDLTFYPSQGCPARASRAHFTLPGLKPVICGFRRRVPRQLSHVTMLVEGWGWPEGGAAARTSKPPPPPPFRGPGLPESARSSSPNQWISGSFTFNEGVCVVV